MLAMLKTVPSTPSKKRALEKDGTENEEPNNSVAMESQSPTGSKRQNCGSRCDPDQDESLATPTNSPVERLGKTRNRRLTHSVAMDTGSPASYPKHVIVPLSAAHYLHTDVAERRSGGYYEYHHPHETPPRHGIKTNIVTPVIHGLEGPHHHYRADYYHPAGYAEAYYHHPVGPYVPSESPSHLSNVVMRPQRWACDYCCVATFVSFEEASIHEKSCPRRPGNHPSASISEAESSKTTPSKPVKANCGLGALYHASQELQQTAHIDSASGAKVKKEEEEGSPIRPPSLSPRFQQLPWSAKEEIRDEPCGGARAANRMLLAMPSDRDSLSDRQCFVRSDFVEIFTATRHDVSSRHSKGAQKLHVGQVGIRCIHCAHLRPKDRAERAVCYPSSISRIYQTVADMQRFHFEQCREIPATTREVYKSLKTTRPRGVGSPQAYWIQSAKKLKLIDSEEGIRLSKNGTKDDAESSMAGTDSDESMQL